MITKMPQRIGQSTLVRNRPVRRTRRDEVDHGGPIYCSRDQDFVWMSGLIDSIQAAGSDVGGRLMKLIGRSVKK